MDLVCSLAVPAMLGETFLKSYSLPSLLKWMQYLRCELSEGREGRETDGIVAHILEELSPLPGHWPSKVTVGISITCVLESHGKHKVIPCI